MIDTVDLTEFLLARIADDKAIARAGDVSPVIIAGRRAGKASAQSYWQRFDPARVLAECASKRRIVELSMSLDARFEDHYAEAVGDVLKLLALPYAEHPDYDESWRP